MIAIRPDRSIPNAIRLADSASASPTWSEEDATNARPVLLDSDLPGAWVSLDLKFMLEFYARNCGQCLNLN